MAIARLSMKVGKGGKAAPHAAYIARQGKYTHRLKTGEKFEATEAGNMPTWARKNTQQFWLAADAYERKNGTTYREMEIALPRELEPAQRAELVRAFVRQEIGETHAYQWAIHTPKAADDGEQPHLHLMFSERQLDGIERDPEHYFKRYNAKTPEKGGSRKGYGPRAGQTLTAAERAADLKELRTRWQDMANEHLERAGLTERIDMRSNAERGIGELPEAKQLPSQWRGEGKAKMLEWRAAKRDQEATADQLRELIPDAAAEVIRLEAERQRQELASMSAIELAEAIARLRPDPLSELVKSDEDVTAAERHHREVKQQHSEAGARSAGERQAIAAWREKHRMQAWWHDQGMFAVPYLRECEQRQEAADQEHLALVARIAEAEQRVRSARKAAQLRITAEQAPVLAKMAELETLHQEKQRQEQEAASKRQLLEDFAELASQREAKASGWNNKGEQWQAVPQKLRMLIDGYNATPKDSRAANLERLVQEFDGAEQIHDLLEEQRKKTHQKTTNYLY